MRSLPTAPLLGLLAACTATPHVPPRPDPGFDRIVVRFSPSGELDGPDLVLHRIESADALRPWAAALAALPPASDVHARRVKLLHDAPEHELIFLKGDRVVDTARMKAGLLDIDEVDGWAFYSGEDAPVRALVEELTPLE